MRTGLLLAAFVVVMAACTKYPGEGGRASIEGTVSIERRLVPTNPNTIQDTVTGADVEVFLVYGDNTSPDDRVWTDYTGAFAFNNLRKGNYTLYIYSDDTSGVDGVNPNRMPILRDIEITERKQVIDVSEVFIYEGF